MEILCTVPLNSTCREVVTITHKDLLLAYYVEYWKSETAQYVTVIRKRHNERLTTPEKKQIKALINEYVKATFK